jgi:Spy/CpxP family protein refolding chaperone
MKSMIKLTLAALTLVVAIPFTRAQDKSTPLPPPPPGEQGEGKHEGMRKGPRGDRLKMLAEKLSLTEDQKTKIKPIVEDEMQAMKTLRDDTTLDKDAKSAKMQEIRKAHRDQIVAILTPDQQKKFEEIKDDRGPGGRGPGGLDGPPKAKE